MPFVIFAVTKLPGFNGVLDLMSTCFIFSVYQEFKCWVVELITTVWVDQISFLLFAVEIFFKSSLSLSHLACLVV